MQDGLIHIFMGVCSKIIIIKKFNVCLIKYNEAKIQEVISVQKDHVIKNWNIVDENIDNMVIG